MKQSKKTILSIGLGLIGMVAIATPICLVATSCSNTTGSDVDNCVFSKNGTTLSQSKVYPFGQDVYFYYESTDSSTYGSTTGTSSPINYGYTLHSTSGASVSYDNIQGKASYYFKVNDESSSTYSLSGFNVTDSQMQVPAITISDTYQQAGVSIIMDIQIGRSDCKDPTLMNLVSMLETTYTTGA